MKAKKEKLQGLGQPQPTDSHEGLVDKGAREASGEGGDAREEEA